MPLACLTHGLGCGAPRYMWKKGHGSSRFGMQNWKRRYFVLEHGVLVYYADASLRSRKGSVNVYGAAVC